MMDVVVDRSGYWSEVGLMKSAGLQELLGQVAKEGHVIGPDDADADDEFFVVQEEDLAFHFFSILIDWHKKKLKD